MAAITAMDSGRMLASEEEESAGPEVAVIFFGVSLVIGIACRQLLRGTRVPYTVALLIIGIGLGALDYGTGHKLGLLGEGIRMWSQINPTLLLYIFLPALLFESSFSMEIHQIKRCMLQMLLLAGPGVLISTFCLGIAIKFTFPFSWTWKTSLLLGGLLSATDPVAVVALLKELGASKKLSTIIEGESLMNDGTAIVVYELFYKMVLGETFSAGSIIEFLCQVSLGGVALGIAFGVASVLWLRFIFNDTVIEITLTLAGCYIAYFAADKGASVSGVLTVMALGMFYSAVARTAFKGESQQSLHYFWEMVAYIANTLIFILSGVVIAESVLESDIYAAYKGVTWGYLILLYVFVQVSRAIVVGLLYPGLRHFGYGLDWKEAVILVWSGLRGAVALSLSLSVKRASDKTVTTDLQQETGSLFVFFTGGIVFLTLIVNGSTTQFVLHFLGMGKSSMEKVRILTYTKYEMLNKALEAFGDLGDDDELGPADWNTVKKYIKFVDDSEESQVHPHNISESQRYLHNLNLRDTRIRLLNGVQAAYWAMLEEGRINETCARILMQSVDEAMDVISSEPLCDWKGLKSHVQFPNYYRYLQMSRLPQKLVTKFTVERLESACYISAAFLRAHRIARRQLYEFIGESEISGTVIQESEAEGEEARKFLEDVRLSFPQVLRVVKTRQVAYSILLHLGEYVHSLEKAGLLEEKEMIHLHDAVQTDLKKLLRDPPSVKMPKISDLLGMHPLLGALPSSLREPLEFSTKERLKLRGLHLYREGARPNGIWLISNGVVRWSSKNLRNKHALHPTFSHGSTLGLYEVLVGMPHYLCDVVTDSVVHCFFLEAEKILSVFKASTSVEDFLWQESALVVAKLLLPETFEKMPMQELRGFVAERSTMKIFLSDEIIELRSHEVGLLLDGFVKPHDGREEFIRAPGALLPQHAERSFIDSARRPGSFTHHGNQYHVEKTSRVILFDMSAARIDGSLRRSSTSWISMSMEQPALQSREHSALISWPERRYMSLKDINLPAEGANQPLSTKAMHLSMFGKPVNMPRLPSYEGSTRTARSTSFPVLSTNVSMSPSLRPLKNVRSHGDSLSLRLRNDNDADVETEPVLPSEIGNEEHVGHELSDESGGEEDLIVTIDSPSTLSFNQRSANVFPPNP